MSSNPKPRQRPDKLLFLLVFGLLLFGIIMVFDASSAQAYMRFNGDYLHYFKNHLFRVAISLPIFFFFYSFDYWKLRRYSGLLLVFAIFSLVFLVVLKFAKYGGQKVLRNIYGFQPSEFARLALIIFLADKLSLRGQYVEDFFRGFIPLMGTVLLVVLLVAVQPSFGMAAALLFGSLMMLFVGKVKLKHMIGIGIIGAIGLTLLIASSSKAEYYALKRLEMFLGKEDEELSYQIEHSITAIATGGIFGRGFSKSAEKGFLPEPHTDFIFSIIAEEFGFIFSMVLLFVFAVFLRQGIRISFYAADSFGAYLAFGITAFFFVYISLNILVAMKFLPTTGIPLPFLSFGGNSLFINMALCGILLNISKYTKLSFYESSSRAFMSSFEVFQR